MEESPSLSSISGFTGKTSFVTKLCSSVIKWGLLALAFLLPLFFLPWTTEVTELNKQLLLFVGVVIVSLAWLGKMLAERRFEYRRTIVNVMVLLFVLVYGISTWASDSTYMSLIGDFGQEQYGFFTVLAFAALYFVAANNITTEKMLQRVLGALMLSGFVAALFGLLQGIGVFVLPYGFAQSASFNTIGTAASLGIFLAFIVTLSGGILLYTHGTDRKPTKKEMIQKTFVALTAVLSLFIIAALDYWPVTVSLMVASVLLIAYSFVHARSVRGMGGILLPVTAIIISMMLLFFKFPLSLGYPAEVMPSMDSSTNIAFQAVQEHSFLGTGPGTFIYDYAKYHSPEVNQTAFWNIRFDRATTSFLTMLATIGLLGIFSWLTVSLFLLGSAAKKLLQSDERTWHILIGLFSAWFLLVLSRFLYSSTMTLAFLFWLMMALLVVVHKHDFYSVRFERSPRAAMLVSFIFIIGVVFSLSGLFVEGQRYAGEIAYTQAVRADTSENIDYVIDKLQTSVSLNSNNDVYLRNLASALLAKSERIINKPLDISQEEDESKEDFQARKKAEAKSRLQEASKLSADAVSMAKRATEVNSVNVANWTTLGSVYRSLTGMTDDAEEWALKSYQEAVEREPNNPSHHTNVGKLYLAKASKLSQELEGKEKEATTEAQTKIDELLSDAVDSLNTAVELKPDYGPAHFSLALALDRQGKLDEAINKMETAIRLNPKDTGVGFQLALLYYRSDQKQKAVNLLQQVIQLSPKHANARWYLAAIHDEMGHKEAAIAQLEKILELNPDNNELVKKRLAKLREEIAPPEEGEGEGEDGDGQAEGEELPPPIEQQMQEENRPEVGQ